MDCTSMGTHPAVWDASTRNGTPRARQTAPILPMSLTAPVTFEACVTHTIRVPAVIEQVRRAAVHLYSPVPRPRISSTDTPPGRKGAQAAGTELCSMLVVTTRSTGTQHPVQRSVKRFRGILGEDDVRGIRDVEKPAERFTG